jgi:hypothetical protein
VSAVEGNYSVPVCKKGDKTGHYNFPVINLVENVEYPSLRVKSVCRQNYLGSSMWVLT